MLITLEKILSPETVQRFQAQLTNAPWIDGKNTAGIQAAAIKTNLQLDDQSPLAITLASQIMDTLGLHPLFISAALPHKVITPKFNCYREQGHYGLHIDNAVMTMPQRAEVMRTDLSATLFLSEPEEYDGGELVVESQYGAQAVKLKAGDMVLYPSTSLHQVLPVTRGERLASFFWIQSMVRNNENRSLLFDLDQSIQTLAATLGSNDPQVKILTGVYHNLVRLWAEL